MVKRITPIKLSSQALREAIDNLERGGYRASEREDLLLDTTAEFVVRYVHERMGPFERRIARIESALGAMGVPCEDS
jgi:hypothetical protein